MSTNPHTTLADADRQPISLPESQRNGVIVDGILIPCTEELARALAQVVLGVDGAIHEHGQPATASPPAAPALVSRLPECAEVALYSSSLGYIARGVAENGDLVAEWYESGPGGTDLHAQVVIDSSEQMCSQGRLGEVVAKRMGLPDGSMWTLLWQGPGSECRLLS